MSRIVLAALAALTLAGCQTASNDPIRYARLDGLSIKNNPTYASQFSSDAAICKGEGAKALMSAGPVYRPNVAASIVADQIVAQNSKNADLVVEGCMASRGYRKDPGQL